MAGMNEDDYIDSDEEVPDISILYEDAPILVPEEIFQRFYSFTKLRGRPVLGREAGELISRLTKKSTKGAVSKRVLTGDPFTDLKTIFFNAKYEEITPYGIRLVKELFKEITDEENQRLYRLVKDNTERRILFIYYGRLTQKMKNEYLRWAAENGHLQVVQFLVENGANIHADDDFALRYAAENGHLQVVQFLVENGANIYADDDYALRLAAENGHLQAVRFLVENGADVHAWDDYALRWAALNGHLQVVQFLVENGANIHADNDLALRWAAENGHQDTVDYLNALIEQ